MITDCGVDLDRLWADFVGANWLILANAGAMKRLQARLLLRSLPERVATIHLWGEGRAAIHCGPTLSYRLYGWLRRRSVAGYAKWAFQSTL